MILIICGTCKSQDLIITSTGFYCPVCREELELYQTDLLAIDPPGMEEEEE